jgi:predicted HAD superfamily Cof-like phosphohydrolase
MNHLEEAMRFRKAMGQPIATTNENVHELQVTLIKEEYDEFLEAFENEFECNEANHVAQLKELADLVFVCYQFAAARGWDLDTALTRVFESNMSKLVDGKPLRREDGKVLKGPNYQPPILDDLV